MAQVSSIEKYEVDSVSNSNLEVVMAGKADHFEHVETQDSQNDLAHNLSLFHVPLCLLIHKWKSLPTMMSRR